MAVSREPDPKKPDINYTTSTLTPVDASAYSGGYDIQQRYTDSTRPHILRVMRLPHFVAFFSGPLCTEENLLDNLKDCYKAVQGKITPYLQDKKSQPKTVRSEALGLLACR